MPVQTRRRPPSMEPTDPPVGAARIPRQRNRRGKATKRGRRKDPRWANLVLIMGALLMMASGGAIVTTKMVIGEAVGSIKQGDLLDNAGKTEAEGGNNLDGPIDMLLLGVDVRANWEDRNNTRADTIIILHIPASHDQAYLISIPRDTEAQIPAFAKSGYGGGVDKINAAFFAGAQNGAGWNGGAQLMAQTIKNMTGISFDGAAIIDFAGFKKIIDALGNVRMCVDQEVASIHTMVVDGKPTYIADAKKSGRPYKAYVHKVGCRDMEGWEALDFSRQRYTDNGDYDRQRHQQQLIKAMAKKATASGVMTDFPKLKELIEAAGKAFIIDTGGVPIADFIFTLRGVAANDLVTLRTNNGTFSSNGAGKEQLNPVSRQMFAAVKADKLGDFIIRNPGVLARKS